MSLYFIVTNMVRRIDPEQTGLITDPNEVARQLRSLTGANNLLRMSAGGQDVVVNFNADFGRVEVDVDDAELSAGEVAVILAAFGRYFEAVLGDGRKVVAKPKPKSKFLKGGIEHLNDGVVTAVGRMVYNYGWSHSLVHSSDMIFAIGELVDTLLEEGDAVVAVESLRFLNPVKHNLKMFACVADDDGLLKTQCPTGKPDVKAVFVVKNAETGLERKVQFVAFQNEEAVSQHVRCSDPNIDFLTSNFDLWESDKDADGKDIEIFDIGEGLAGMGAECNAYQMMNVIMELVMNAYCVLRKFGKGIIPPAQFSIATAFEMKKIPEFRDIESGCRLEIMVDLDSMLEKPNGWRFFPVRFNCFNK